MGDDEIGALLISLQGQPATRSAEPWPSYGDTGDRWPGPTSPPGLGDGKRLSRCERRVALLMAAGQSNLEIATSLHVSVYTVKTQVKSILRKLGMQSRWQVRDAFAAGRLPEPGES